MTLRAVGYRRVSTNDQAENGHSLDAQQGAIEAFVRRKGWQIGPLYTDAGISGSLEHRPGLKRLLRDADSGQFDVVVIPAIDRFYRSLSGLLNALERLRQKNVSLVSINENLDFTTPWGKLSLAVLGMLAEIYLDKLRQETKRGLKERARKGYYNGSIPFGYCNGRCSSCTDPNGPGYCPWVHQVNRGDGEVPVPHPIEAIGVRRAFEMSATGKCSDREIATRLNRNPVYFEGRVFTLRPKRQPHQIKRFGAPIFQKDTVREMLLRPFYLGLVPYYGVNSKGTKRKRQDSVALFPGKHPALITEDLFEEVQQTRKLRSSAPIITGERTYVYPLSGLLICGHCGAKMRASSNAGGRRYYRCSSKIKQQGVCEQKTVRADEIEGLISEKLSKFTLPEGYRQRLLDEFNQGEDRDGARQKTHQKLERLKELYLEGDIERSSYEKNRAIYRQRLLDLTDTSLTAMIATISLVQNFTDLWQGEKTTQKKLLRAMLTAVIVRDDVLSGWSPNSASYPVLCDTASPGRGGLCQCGSDGT